MQTTTSTKRVRSNELSSFVGSRVRLQGWLHAVRSFGGVSFLIIRDGWGTAQVVLENPQDAEISVDDLTVESVLSVEGEIVANPQAPEGIELHHPSIHFITQVADSPPVTMSKRQLNAALPTLLDHAVIANRHPQRRAIFKLAAAVMQAFRASLSQRGFTEIQTPKIVAAATESGANLFTLDYFGQPAYLAQSPQFYKQIMVGVFERVFEVGPVFRAEPHDTIRHVNEYVSLDVEFGFIQDHFTVMELLRHTLHHVFSELNDSCSADLKLAGASLPSVPRVIPHIHFSAAQALLEREYHIDLTGEMDLAPQHERWLGTWAQQTHGSDFLFVTGYPMQKRPFYTHPQPDNPLFSNSFDLLFRGTELVTGGQRLHRYADYQEALADRELPSEPFAAYLETFRFGMPPHGGFAIGLERLIMQLTGAPNLRLTTLFPRDLARLTP